MRRDAREERRCFLAVKSPNEVRHRRQSRHTKARHRERVFGDAADRGQDRRRSLRRPRYQGADQFLVRDAVATEARCRVAHRSRERHCSLTLEWVGEGDLGPTKSHAACGEVEVAKERGNRQHGLDRRTDIVVKPGQRQLFGPATATRTRLSFKDFDVQSGSGEHQRRRQTVRARAHDGRVHVWPLAQRSRTSDCVDAVTGWPVKRRAISSIASSLRSGL